MRRITNNQDRPVIAVGRVIAGQAHCIQIDVTRTIAGTVIGRAPYMAPGHAEASLTQDEP